ncbi:hypothetical protein D9611_006374 [Ephemerocybe angulata]|uniref:Uncharacterized protein n=1 Tax=Ephemerocybe angulata TaxID=980116 RepID=A0A8H5C6K2_9AGAR|nr:hypothetical protein D9611_006374 [Tulosesus angulatus]
MNRLTSKRAFLSSFLPPLAALATYTMSDKTSNDVKNLHRKIIEELEGAGVEKAKIEEIQEGLEGSELNMLKNVERLRMLEIKTTHYERKTEALEGEVLRWEDKHEELLLKYKSLQRDFTDLQASVEPDI